MKSTSFIGAGRLARSLAAAMQAAGWPITHVASRSFESAATLSALLPGSRPVPIVEAARSDWVFLTVPDDAIENIATSLTWCSHQKVLHCSGATEISALSAATMSGAQTGSFHPLQIFSGQPDDGTHLRGCTVALEARPGLLEEITDMAHMLGMQPIQLPPGSRPLYHAAAGYAASMIIALLGEASQIWKALGMDEAQSLRALLPLARGTLDAVEKRNGLAAALSGPVSRGDASVLQKHARTLHQLGQQHGEIYRRLTERQIAIAQSSNQLSNETVQKLRRALEMDCDSGEESPGSLS